MKRMILGLAAALLPISALAAPTPHSEDQTMPAQSVHSYILLDRTGSMQDIWEEALSSVNAYATSFGEADEDDKDLATTLSLAVFDSQDGLKFDVLREGVSTDAWTPVTTSEASPRGMTPLFDAIGRMVALAEGDNPEKAVLVIMTDGMENASREVTKAGARAALDRIEARGWEVVFLGAEFANFDDADGVGVARSKQMAVGAGQLSQSMERLAKKSRDYGQAAEAAAPVIFDEEDRAVAGEEDVKQRKGQR